MAIRQETKAPGEIGDYEWQLDTVDAITGARVLASLTKNLGAILPAIDAARGKGDDKVALFLSVLGGGLGHIDSDRLIEDVMTLLTPLKMGPKRVPVSREALGAVLSGEVETLARLGWWALGLNYPFVLGLAASARASRGAVSGPPSSAPTRSGAGTSAGT